MPFKSEGVDEVIKKLSDIKISDSDTDLEKAAEMPGGANVKLPEFWAKEPALWFVRAEGQFANKDITTEAMKHSHVVEFWHRETEAVPPSCQVRSESLEV